MTEMNFNELVPGAKVRFTVMNGVQYLSVKDLIKAVCDKDDKRASEAWINLPEERKSEVSEFLGNLKFRGPGQKTQPVITFPGALKLIMWLPGENAKQMRSKVAEILLRYFAGDPSLLADIQANAASDSPINQAARAALHQQECSPSLNDLSEESLVKRRKLTDDLTGSVRASSVEVRNFTADLSECNIAFEKHIDLKERNVNIDQKSYSVKRADFSLLKKIQKQELQHKRALQQIQAGSIPVPAPIPVPLAPTQTTTVLKVYEANRSSFKRLNQDKREQLLQKAGALAAQLFRQKTGTYPLGKQQERRAEVNVYPLDAEPIIMEALRKVYRQIMAGYSQPSIIAVFAGPAVSI